MVPERWERIKEILSQLLEAPAQLREELLRKACACDQELEREVRELLDRASGRSSARSETDTGTALSSTRSSPQSIDLNSPFQPGEVIANRFQLLRLLGTGGMGQVWEAFDQVLRVKLAVKTLQPEFLSDSSAIDRFHREILTARGVTHRNICRVYELYAHEDNDKKIPLLTMELINGESLAERLARGQLPLPYAVALLQQCAEALDAAHRVGVIHRDFKPGNIMLAENEDSQPDAVVMDFGLARPRRNGEGGFITVGGTPGYMAPEQMDGKDVQPSADVYAFAMVACELLTGRRAFDGGLEMLPGPWRRPIRKALDVNPNQRPGSASAVLRDVKARTIRRRVWLSSVVLVISTLALFFGRRAQDLPPTLEIVAVLPFENRTGDTDLSYLSEGLTESLIGDLSRVPTIRVSALGAVMKYEGRKLDARAAGRELGAGRLINGSFATRDGDVFIHTELIDVVAGTRIWGKDYSCKRSSLTDMLEQFSTEVTDQLRLQLSGPLRDRLKRQYAVGSRTYEQYLKARYHLSKRTPADFDQAIQYFSEVVTSNPEYAPGYAGLADTWAWMAIFGYPFLGDATPRDTWEHARDAAERALQRDGTLADAYNALAMVEEHADFNWTAAKADFLRSIDLNPNVAETHENYSWELAALGQTGEAIREMHLAERLEPDNSHIWAAHALVLYMGRRYEDSLKICTKVAQIHGGLARVGQLMAMNYWMTSRPNEAQRVLRSMPKDFSDLYVPLIIAAARRAGQLNEARALYEKHNLQNERPWWYALALAHLSLDKVDDAVTDLEKAYQERSGEIIWIGVDPLFDTLHSNSRFRRLLSLVDLSAKPM